MLKLGRILINKMKKVRSIFCQNKKFRNNYFYYSATSLEFYLTCCSDYKCNADKKNSNWLFHIAEAPVIVDESAKPVEEVKKPKPALGNWVTVAGESSPPRRRDDNSPPRRRAEDNSPPRRRAEDASPPRRRAEDVSPPRRRAEDASPPRRRAEDASPPRRQTEDASPPRRANTDTNRKRSAASVIEEEGPTKKRRMLDGGKAGLLTDEDVVREEEAYRAAQEAKFKNRDLSELGKGAQTVYRDSKGRRLDTLVAAMKQQQGELMESEEANMEWGVGRVDVKKREEDERRKREEADAPYKGKSMQDNELNNDWKQEDRWGDPMAKFRAKGDKKEKKKEYQGWWPPNRFNLAPGYRWDGIDRSNGFEKNYFLHQNSKKAMQDVAYRFLSEDM
jgi:pre-mRNA-splicing factor CWC26